MLVIAVRCPRCLLTVYTHLIDDATLGIPATTSNGATDFMVAPLADEDLLFYNCPMNVCEYHVPTPAGGPRPTNLYRNVGTGLPMHITPGLVVAERTSETRPLRTQWLVAALKIKVDVPATTTNTIAGAAARGVSPASLGTPVTMTAWGANAVPLPTTGTTPTSNSERPAAEQTTGARFAVMPQTPHQGNGLQFRPSGTSFLPVADIPRPTSAQPTTEKKPAASQPAAPQPTTPQPTSVEKPTSVEEPPSAKRKQQAPVEKPATKRAAPQAVNSPEAEQSGSGSSEASDTEQQTPGRLARGKWTDAEVEKLKELKAQNLTHAQIGTTMNRSGLGVKCKLADLRKKEG